MKLVLHCALQHLQQQNMLLSCDEPQYIDNARYEICCFVNKTPKAVMRFFVQVKKNRHLIDAISIENFGRHFGFNSAIILQNCIVTHEANNK